MLENDRVGGSRTYTGPEAHVAAIWKCPACGEQNDGPLANGCVHCGSGKPGEHKGVDPVVTPEERARILAAQHKTPEQRIVRAPQPGQLFNGGDHFFPWLIEYTSHERQFTTGEQTIMYAAFLAGWKAAREGTVAQSVERLSEAQEVGDSISPGPTTTEEGQEPPQFPPAQIKERTLLAALRFFRQSILPEAGEEVATGEWLAVADVDAWIVELEKELGQ